VRTKDRAGNLSAVVAFRFNVGRAGLLRPNDADRTVARLPIQVQAQNELTHVKLMWRRGPGAAVEDDIPAANLRTADGSPMPAGFVPLASLGGPAPGGLAVWNATDTLGAAAGVVQVKAVLATDANGTGAYSTTWRTAVVDPDADGAEAEELAGGSLNLLTGDFTQSTTDAEEFGLTVSRSASSRDPRHGYQTQRERLTVNQQKISTDTAGFVPTASTLTRVTDRGHESTEALQIDPPAAGTGTDTFAAVEADSGGMRLGMKAGRLYRVSGWMYVPAATGLEPPDAQGEKIVVVVKDASGAYQALSSPRPTVIDAWVQLTLDVPIPVGASEAFIRLYNGFAPGSSKSIFLDDLSVRELTAPFGPQWSGGTTIGDDAAGGFTRLTVDVDDVVQIETVDGGKVWFTRGADGTLFPEPGAEDLTLTFDGAVYTLRDTDGTVTTFARATDGGAWLVATSTPPIQAATTRYIYETLDDQVRVKRAIAPVETGVGDCATPIPARGCEALDYEYAPTTTAVPGTFGDYAGQVRAVAAWTTNPANGAVEKVTVAQYVYDEFGRLREVWDPRLAQPLKTVYTYDSAGRVVQAGATGELPWSFDYGTAGLGDPNAGRLLRARRAALVPGTIDTLDGDVASTVVYNVPLTRAAGGPYDLDAAAAGTWSQTDIPTDATAVFGPEDIPSTSSASTSAPGPDGYRAATVHYLNAAAKETNTAVPGGYIDTTEHDRFGNTVRVLEASNRALALGQLPDSDAKLAPLGLAQYDTRTRATWLDTQNTYAPDGIDLIGSLSPLQRVALDTDPTQLVNARAQVLNTYDEGKPDGTTYHLITTERTGARVVGMNDTQDVRVTKTGYAPALGGVAGWPLRVATSTTLDAEGPAGAPLTTQVKLDDRGRARESRKIDATGTDAGTTKSVFYTAAANPDDPSCGNRPEWAGSACLTTVGGPVTGHDPARMSGNLPVKRVESYTRFGEADRVSETVDGKSRTTVTTFDGADRVTAVEILGDIGTPVGKVTTSYDPATGDALTTALPDGSTITRGYDRLGRLRTYTDADGSTTTTEFDRFGKPARITDTLGASQSFTYDRTIEPRGLLTSVTDSVAGTMTARYGPDGQITEQTLPGGVNLTTTQDPAGRITGRTYVRASDNMLIAASTAVDNVRGQTIALNGPGSQKKFGYDRWGRLTTATQLSTATGTCTIRDYAYDRRSNRTAKTTRAGSSAGVCPAAGDPAQSESNTYDSADRISNPGYTYDTFGRITQTPTGLTSGYYVNDLLATQQQGDQRMSWTLDPNLRARRFTSEKQVNGAWANNVTKINHYGADNDEPRWIAEDLTQPDNLTRNIESPDGDLAATTSKTGNVVLELTSLHGDVMATVPVDPAGSTITGAVTVVDTDEFGLPSADTPASATARYAWLGGKQRSGETLGDTILMGARVYDPASGRFLQVDPEPGGNATAYDYCSADPVNCTDLDGRWSIGSIFKSVATVAARVGELASWIPGPIGAIGAGVAAGAYAATGNWRKAGEMALVGAAALVGAGAAVKIGIRVVKASIKVHRAASAERAGRLAIKYPAKQLQRKFKHAGDFGVSGNYSKKNAKAFEAAMRKSVSSRMTKSIDGKYHGQPATLYHHRLSGRVVVAKEGKFVTGFKMNSKQRKQVRRNSWLW
jgi:RHS repeat-associated protein